MQIRQPADYFKQLQRNLTTKNFSELETLLLFKNLPVIESHANLSSKFVSKGLLESNANFFRIVDLLLMIRTPLDSDLLSSYQQVAKELSYSTVFCEMFEFKVFFKQLFQRMKADLRRKKQLTENSLDVIISALRQIFAELKKSEFYQALTVTLNSLFYLYFKINQFHQCTYLLKMIEPYFKIIFQYSDRVESMNLHYYIARLNHFSGDLEEVEEHLDKVLQLAFTKKQLRQTLKILIPVKINLGKFPTAEMLRQFDLKEYESLSLFIKEGNLHAFNELVDRNMPAWIRSGVYFMLHECKNILMRNLVKKVWLILDKPRSISLKHIQAAMSFHKEQAYSIDEVVSLTSGLIYKDYVRGLVYPDDCVLHLKKDPFSNI